MATGKTTIWNRLRVWACVFLAITLCAPLLSGGISLDGRRLPNPTLALAAPSPAVQTNRSGQRWEGLRQFAAGDTPFLLVRAEDPASNWEHLGVTSTQFHPPLFFAPHNESGRSPPAIP